MVPNMGTHMKTTVDIDDPLFHAAKAEAQRRGVTVRSLIEEGLRRVLAAPDTQAFVLADCSVDGGGPTARWSNSTWGEKLADIYEGRA